MKDNQVVLIPGDGIGPEVAEAVKFIFKAAQLPIFWVEAEAGECAMSSDPSGLPGRTLDLVRQYGLALKGPTTTPVGKGHQSVNVLLRKQLGLFANVRPARSIPSLKTPFQDIDLIIVRENLEDTYSGIEYMQSPSVAQGLKVITELGSSRVIQYAFELARREKRRSVTCVHKANIHKLSDGLFLRVFNQLREQYSDVESRDLIVDNTCMQLVTRPERFDVMVMPNLYGDIVSDLTAGLVGGLGVAPSGNIGPGVAVFEAVHGSAPDIAGQGLANPLALLLSGLMLLRHLGMQSSADSIMAAVLRCCREGLTTKDLGGNLKTMEFAEALSGYIEPVVTETPEVATHTLAATEGVKVQRQDLVGIDVYVKSDSTPAFELAGGVLKLKYIFNRGTRLDANAAKLEMVDVFCLRFLADGSIEPDQIEALLSKITKQGLAWVHCEKLYRFDGVPGFSGPI